MLVKMRQAIRLTYANTMHQTCDGKFSKPLAEVTIVVFYIAFMRKLIDVNDINTYNSELKEQFLTLIQGPTFRGYIKEGTNNPGTIDAENEFGERKGRYPLMIDMLCQVFTLASSDFY